MVTRTKLTIFVLGFILSQTVGLSAQSLYLKDFGADYQWIWYTSGEGTPLSLHMFSPENHTESSRHPAVVFIHGGGFVSGHPSFFFPHCRYFAARGAVAFSISYRIIEKKGLDGIDAIRDCITDCKSALRHIRINAELYGVDPDRIAVIGDSSGGHLAACMGMIDDFDAPGEDRSVSSMANAVVLYNPPVDLDIQVFNRVFSIQEFGQAEMELINRYSPIKYIKPSLPPVLVMHGTEDTVIPIEQIYRFNEAMKKAGNRCEIRVLDGIKHAFVIIGIGTEETIVGALRETDTFLISLRYLEGVPTLNVSKEPVR